MEPTTPPLVLITGGSRGIGAATALAAARGGWDVALNYRSDLHSARAVQALIQGQGRQAWLLPGDVADEAQVLAVFVQLDALKRPVRALVNNAGVVDVAQRVDEMSAARVQRMFAVNVMGSFACAREALRRMSRRHGGQGGVIVNLSSAAARLGSPGQYVDYAAAKAAIDTFTLGLAREVAAEGVRVNAVRPGIIDTDIHASGGQPQRAQQLAPQVPMQRAGSADEVAQAIVWLMSDAASYCTGAILDVSGGR
jgi:NAD(P)-dependent dehydrogenase (short-subunit alcohol dehydrogenase family)